MGKACELAVKRQAKDHQHVKNCRDGFLAGLATLSGWDINGDIDQRIPHNINISFEGIDSETLRLAVPELSMSAGSACHVGQMHASHVLKALGLPIRRCQGAVRISFGKNTTIEDIALATDRLSTAVNQLRGAQAPVD
jgi:cysteine desulfurase